MYIVTARNVKEYFVHEDTNQEPEDHTIKFKASEIKKVRCLFNTDTVELDFRNPEGKAGYSRAVSFEFNKIE